MTYTTVLESLAKVWIVADLTFDQAYDLSANMFDRKQCHRVIMIDANGKYVSVWTRH